MESSKINCEHTSFECFSKVNRFDTDGVITFAAVFSVKCTDCDSKFKFVHTDFGGVRYSVDGLQIAAEITPSKEE